MNCQNCGSQLMGVEQVCPVCGAPVASMIQQQQQMMQQQQQMTPAQPGMYPVGNDTGASEEVPKKDNKMFAIILFLVALAAIGVGVFLAITGDGDGGDNSGGNGGQVEPAPTTTSIEYAGYTFSFSSEYKSSISKHLGLLIKDTSLNRYFINVDYSHTYDDYKKDFTEKYPDKIESMVAEIGEEGNKREFLVANIASDDGTISGLQFVTKGSSEDTTFIGFMVKPEYENVKTEEMIVLCNLLNTAVKTGEVVKGSELDMGRNGIRIYSVVKDYFEEAEETTPEENTEENTENSGETE